MPGSVRAPEQLAMRIGLDGGTADEAIVKVQVLYSIHQLIVGHVASNTTITESMKRLPKEPG